MQHHYTKERIAKIFSLLCLAFALRLRFRLRFRACLLRTLHGFVVHLKKKKLITHEEEGSVLLHTFIKKSTPNSTPQSKIHVNCLFFINSSETETDPGTPGLAGPAEETSGHAVQRAAQERKE